MRLPDSQRTVAEKFNQLVTNQRWSLSHTRRLVIQQASGNRSSDVNRFLIGRFDAKSRPISDDRTAFDFSDIYAELKNQSSAKS